MYQSLAPPVNCLMGEVFFKDMINPKATVILPAD
jgi:hypothetical protein